MIGLVAATVREARPLIEACAAVEVSGAPFETWRAVVGKHKRDVRLVLSGVGKVAAAAATASLLSQHKVDWLVNFGVCGALVDRDDLLPGTLCQVTTAVEGDRLGMGDAPAGPVTCHHVESIELVPAALVTVDRPVFDADRRRTLSALGQIVDMEGAAVARTAAWFGTPCTLIKGITDPAGEGGRQRLLARLDDVSAALATSLAGSLTA